jgi:hypothetical protein
MVATCGDISLLVYFYLLYYEEWYGWLFRVIFGGDMLVDYLLLLV